MIVEVRGKVVPANGWPLFDEDLANLVERHKAYGGNLTVKISAAAAPIDIPGQSPRVILQGVLEAWRFRCPRYKS